MSGTNSMDDADSAKDYEMKDRKAALSAALHRTPLPEQRRNDEGDVICLDCEQLIEEARLAVRPEAVRCIECKQQWEKAHNG